MAREFDQTKDMILWSETLGSGLELSVRSYDGGSPKLHIGPRWKERDGERVATKAGRLGAAEFSDMMAFVPEIERYLLGKPPLKGGAISDKP